jgi:hypothetical protein
MIKCFQFCFNFDSILLQFWYQFQLAPLYNVALFPLSAMFGMCTLFLCLAAFLQKKLEMLALVGSSSSVYSVRMYEHAP